MIRGQLEKNLVALDCVSGGIDENGMFSIRDKETLVAYSEISTTKLNHIITHQAAYDIKDPIRRKALLHILQEYADTPLEKR